MRNRIILALAALAVLVGCGTPENNVPAKPKWKGATYHIAFETKETKPNPAGITIPAITYEGNPALLERRAALVIRFDVTGGKKDTPIMNQMIMAATDIPGANGALPGDYMSATSKELAQYLGSYCLKGKVKLSIAFERSSVNPRPTDAELESKRLSDWLPIELNFKNPHPTC